MITFSDSAMTATSEGRDRFVRFLSFLCWRTGSGIRQVFLAESIANIAAHHVDRILAQVG